MISAPGAGWRLREAVEIPTAALGAIRAPRSYRWRVGIGPFVWPWPSRALLLSSLAHDVAYDAPWTREHLRRADRAFAEVYIREGGAVPALLLIWPALRAWAWISVNLRRRA